MKALNLVLLLVIAIATIAIISNNKMFKAIIAGWLILP